MNRFFKYIVGVLIFFTVFAPANLMKVKISLISILLFVSIIKMMKKNLKVKINRGVFLWFVVYITMSVIYTCISIINNNPNPTNFLVINIVTPIIYFAFILSIGDNFKAIEWIINVLLASAVFVMIYNILFFIVINLHLSFPPVQWFHFVYKNIGGLNLGYTKITSENITYLFFVIPLFFTRYLMIKKKTKDKMVIIIILLGLINSFIFVRTVFIIIMIICPVLVMLFAKINRVTISRNKILLLVLASFLVLFVVNISTEFNIDLVYQKVLGSFSSKVLVNEYGIVDSGGAIRLQQLRSLLDTWKIRPLFGWGDAAVIIDSERAGVSGVYELSYFAILMQRGLIGFSVYIGQLVWIVLKLMRISNESLEMKKIAFPIVIGFVSFLITNATNPYLYSFDRMLILYLPLLVINAYNLSRTNKNLKDEVVIYGTS